jgi:hypothetical protein
LSDDTKVAISMSVMESVEEDKSSRED